MSPADPDPAPAAEPRSTAVRPAWLVPVLGVAATVLLVAASVVVGAALARRQDPSPPRSASTGAGV
ncbi:MAG: hypothetical protein KDA98_10250, partial [Acidimicrobiales bacterium]|nr:hypothetical protein [Acidimicrobiales bacterium]